MSTNNSNNNDNSSGGGVNSAAVPTINPDLFGDGRWMSIHKRFVSDTQEKEPEVLFIGDSLIAYLQLTEMWDTHFAPLHSLNFGIGGERTEHVLWRVENGEMDNVSPKAVVLLIGTNNHGCTPQQVAEGILTIVQVVRGKQPQAEILVLSLLPRGEKPNPIRERNENVNRILKDKIVNGQMDKTHFVNIDPGYVGPDGSISHHDMWDFLHLSKSGYLKSFEVVHEMLLQMLTDIKDVSVLDMKDQD